MDLTRRLRQILHRVHVAEREVELEPEVFQATAELPLAATDLACVIAELEGAQWNPSSAVQ